MAVKRIKLVKEGRDGRWTVTSGRTYTLTYLVITDDPHDGPFTVLTAMGAKNGDHYKTPYEEDKTSYLMELAATPAANDGKQWNVVASYGPYNAAAQGDPEDPLKDPLDVNWGFKATEDVVDFDKDDKAIVNTAGEPFDPPLTEDRQVPTLTIVRNESLDGFSLPAIRQYIGAVNTDTFAGWDAGTAKCANIQPKRVYNATIGYYLQVQYDFEFDERGFHRRLPSIGMRQLVGGSLKQIMIQGTAATSPMLLDENGAMLPPGADPHILEFRTRNELAFEAFSFDEDILTGQA